MRIEDAKIILDYAADIPKKLRAIAEEQAEIEAELTARQTSRKRQRNGDILSVCMIWKSKKLFYRAILA